MMKETLSPRSLSLLCRLRLALRHTGLQHGGVDDVPAEGEFDQHRNQGADDVD